jgi:hypothetical protein
MSCIRTPEDRGLPCGQLVESRRSIVLLELLGNFEPLMEIRTARPSNGSSRLYNPSSVQWGRNGESRIRWAKGATRCWYDINGQLDHFRHMSVKLALAQ